MTGFSNRDRERLAEVHVIVKRQDKLLQDHEHRIRKNESMRYKILGVAASVGAGFSLLGDFITKKLGL